jgi:prepilin-type N-terminal cleavage/methylation domain-containing protein
MKRLIKRSNRKGFTLVETLLATFILVVISTMLINGFLTTMGYSYQTAVYNKSAAMNYSLCMEYSGTWGRKANNLANGREAEAVAQNYVTGNNHDLVFYPGPDYTACETLSVAIIKKDGLGDTVPGSMPFQSEVFAPRDGSDEDHPDHRVDNRTALIYFPEYCSDEGAHVGEIVVMLDVSDPDNPTYYWVIAEPNADETKDPYDSNNKLKKDFDLTSLSDDDIIAEVGVHGDT